MKKVSVAIICYNQENFIRETLESVITQDYSNIEICIVDDCSKDTTPDIIREYAARFENNLNISFKYILSEQNVGIVANYNKVLELCSGDYIAWLDGDDLFLPGKLSIQVAFMNANPNCIISHTGAEIFNNSTQQIILNHGYLRNPANGRARTLMRNGANFVNCTNMVVASWQKKIMFNTKYKVLGDWMNKVEILLASGGEINYLNQTLSRYRIHGNNATKSKSGLIGQNVLDFISQHIDLINKHPQYCRDLLFGLSKAYRSLGKHHNIMFYKVSFYLSPFYWKNLIMYLAVVLGIKKSRNEL